MGVQIRPDLSGSVRVCPDLLIVSPSLSALFQRCLADRQAACKPGSVPDAANRSAHRAAAIHLGRRLPAASCDLPGDGPGRAIVSLFGLAPGGACSAGRSPDRWCALTAPSHPYRRPPEKKTRGRTGWRCVSVRFPSARAAWELPSALSRGARTFLDPRPGQTRPETAAARRPGEIHFIADAAVFGCACRCWTEDPQPPTYSGPRPPSPEELKPTGSGRGTKRVPE